MAPPCPLPSKRIENEVILFKPHDLVYLLNQGITMTMPEFHECDFGENVRIRIGMEFEKEPSSQNLPVPKPSLTKATKPEEPSKPFKVDYPQVNYNLTLDNSLFEYKAVPPPPPEPPPPQMDLPIEGFIATAAMALALFQQAKQKKNEAEAQKCCAESKVKFSEFDAKLQKLDAKIEERTQKESKALHAEIYEQYKELKELREDSQHVKEVLQQMIDFMKKKT